MRSLDSLKSSILSEIEKLAKHYKNGNPPSSDEISSTANAIRKLVPLLDPHHSSSDIVSATFLIIFRKILAHLLQETKPDKKKTKAKEGQSSAPKTIRVLFDVTFALVLENETKSENETGDDETMSVLLLPEKAPLLMFEDLFKLTSVNDWMDWTWPLLASYSYETPDMSHSPLGLNIAEKKNLALDLCKFIHTVRLRISQLQFEPRYAVFLGQTRTFLEFFFPRKGALGYWKTLQCNKVSTIADGQNYETPFASRKAYDAELSAMMPSKEDNKDTQTKAKEEEEVKETKAVLDESTKKTHGSKDEKKAVVETKETKEVEKEDSKKKRKFTGEVRIHPYKSYESVWELANYMMNPFPVKRQSNVPSAFRERYRTFVRLSNVVLGVFNESISQEEVFEKMNPSAKIQHHNDNSTKEGTTEQNEDQLLLPTSSSTTGNIWFGPGGKFSTAPSLFALQLSCANFRVTYLIQLLITCETLLYSLHSTKDEEWYARDFEREQDRRRRRIILPHDNRAARDSRIRQKQVEEMRKLEKLLPVERLPPPDLIVPLTTRLHNVMQHRRREAKSTRRGERFVTLYDCKPRKSKTEAPFIEMRAALRQIKRCIFSLLFRTDARSVLYNKAPSSSFESSCLLALTVAEILNREDYWRAWKENGLKNIEERREARRNAWIKHEADYKERMAAKESRKQTSDGSTNDTEAKGDSGTTIVGTRKFAGVSRARKSQHRRLAAASKIADSTKALWECRSTNPATGLRTGEGRSTTKSSSLAMFGAMGGSSKELGTSETSVAPLVSEFCELFAQCEDPSEGVEDEYHVKHNEVYCWRALRLMGDQKGLRRKGPTPTFVDPINLVTNFCRYELQEGSDTQEDTQEVNSLEKSGSGRVKKEEATKPAEVEEDENRGHSRRKRRRLN
eukprot:g1842.t1